MGRTFGFNWQRAEAQMQAREDLVSSLVDTERASELGVTREGLENVCRMNRAQVHDVTPTEDRGSSMKARIKGEPGYRLLGEHVNAHGDRLIEAVRPVGGGRYERVRIREEQAGPRTRIVSEIR